MRIMRCVFAVAAVGVLACGLNGQTASSSISNRPDPKEIPMPTIKTSMPNMPGVDQLPDRPEMPDVMTLDNGKKVKTLKQWEERRAEMKRILEYYAVGLAPPPPGNVKGTEVSSQMLMDGKVKYRLVHLTFGRKESLSLDIGIFTPAQGGPFPALVSPSGSPPGATPLPRLPQGPNQGQNEDVLLRGGSGSAGAALPEPANAMRAGRFGLRRTAAEQIAEPQSGACARLCVCDVQQQRLRRRHHAAQCPTEAGPTGPRDSFPRIPNTTGDCCARGRGALRESWIISSPTPPSTRTS